MAQVRVFCPCSEKLPLHITDAGSLELSSYPATIEDCNTLHLPSYLNFCEVCQAVKCRKCIELEVVTKYCPRCLQEMKPEYSFCSRNCLDCPWCCKNLIITQDKETRTFKMRCSSCEYQYETPVLDKLKSMSRVVKSEMNKCHEMKRFSDLEKFYIQEKQLYAGQIDIPRQVVTEFAQLKVKDYDIYEFMRRSSIKAMTDDTAIVDQYANQSSNGDTIPYDISLRGATFSKTNALPLQTKLICKHSKRCKACRTLLVKPDHDPASVKFYKLSNAVDFIPSIRVLHNPTHVNHLTPSSTNKYVMAIQNPLDLKVNVSVSASPLTPGPLGHRVHIPISSFSLKPKSDSPLKLDQILQSTPSIELTKSTKLSRVELMNRPSVKYESEESILEQRANYVMIPIRIELNDKSTKGCTVTVPILLSFKGDGIAVAFWVVLDMGEVQ